MLVETPSDSPLIKAAHDKELRAGERVFAYLLAEFDRPNLKGGSRLPTNKELATRLNVSPGTVQAVLRKLAQEGRIRSQRGSGTYLEARAEPSHRMLRIGIGAPLQKLHDTDGWISRIGGGIFQAALKRQALLEGISNRDSCSEGMIAELLEKMEKFDGLILLPYTAVSHHESLIATYENSGKPVVHIHPPSLSATANFATTGFFGASYAMGQVWKKTGRQRVFFLTNFTEREGKPPTVSDQLRYAGLASGLGLGLQSYATLRACESVDHGQTEEAGYETIKRLLGHTKKIPDAVYCAGDWLALGAARAFRDAGIRVPGEVSIVGAGGMNLAHTEFPGLTRVRNELEQVGQEAVELIIRRIQLQGLSLPGVVVPTSFLGGATSRPEENVLLEIIRGGIQSHKGKKAEGADRTQTRVTKN